MAEQDNAEAQVTDQFTGLNLNTGRTSVPFGAMVVQTNMTGNQTSEIASRPGLSPVEFDE